MQVQFRTAQLRRCYERLAEGSRRWGKAIVRCYVERINIFYACETPDDLSRILPLRFHPLKGDRQGQFGMVLQGRWRLIVSFPADPPKTVRVEEVSKHYGD